MQVSEKRRFNLTKASVSTFLLANAFVWYLCAFKFLQDASTVGSADTSLLSIAVNFLAFAFSAVIGSKITRFTQNRRGVIQFWILTGVCISFLFLTLSLDPNIIVVLAGIIGAFFGLGMPTFMGYFSASTEPNNRAKFGGITVLAIMLAYATITAITSNLGGIATATTLAVWLVTGLIALIYFNPPDEKTEPKDTVSFRSVVSNRTFVLYIVPWLMFSLINDLTMQINNNYFNNLQLTNHLLIENLLAGFSAVVCGILADRKGRKRVALIGFALLGVGYAALGLFNGNILGAWFYICADGVAAGIFTSLFLMTVWGDIAQEKSSEKYYLIGVLPYLFSTFAGTTLGTVMSGVISENTMFSFAAFFLFAATLPLFYAPETLPEKLMKDRDLKSYIENAKKKANKDAEKTKRKENANTADQQKPDEPTQDDKNYEEAKALAEKYY